MDILGPLQLRLTWRALQEAQVVISTCTTTRAFHLELITSIASKAFQIEFHPFVTVRCHPNVCWSAGLCLKLHRSTRIPERSDAKLGHSQDSRLPFRGIHSQFRVVVEHPTCEPPERSWWVANQVHYTGPNSVFSNRAFNEEQWAPLPKFGRRLGRTTHSTEWHPDWTTQSVGTIPLNGTVVLAQYAPIKVNLSIYFVSTRNTAFWCSFKGVLNWGFT